MGKNRREKKSGRCAEPTDGGREGFERTQRKKDETKRDEMCISPLCMGVTLSPINFYSSASTYHGCKSLSAGPGVCVWVCLDDNVFGACERVI